MMPQYLPVCTAARTSGPSFTTVDDLDRSKLVRAVQAHQAGNHLSGVLGVVHFHDAHAMVGDDASSHPQRTCWGVSVHKAAYLAAKYGLVDVSKGVG